MFLFLSGWVLCSCSLIGESPSQACECSVRDVIAIRSPVSFVCRASEWDRVGPARLLVTIRGIEVPDISAAETQRVLGELLTHARAIRLGHIEMGSFFRLTADVEVDGKDAAGILTAKGLAKKVVTPEIVKAATPSGASTTTKPEVKITTVKAHNPVRTPSKTKGIVSDWKSLLDRPVDLSSITPATPFREALEQVRTSIEPALPMMINWNDLRQNAFIEETSPVGVDGLGHMGIGQALELICNAVDGGKGQVSFTQRGRVLVVASKQSLGNPKSMRIIDISELTAPQSTGFGMNGMSGGYGSGSGSGYGSGYGSAGSTGNQLGGMMNNMTSGINGR
jgi:hypothetical protein